MNEIMRLIAESLMADRPKPIRDNLRAKFIKHVAEVDLTDMKRLIMIQAVAQIIKDMGE